MTGWNFFFTLMGISFMTAQVFRLINVIEQPSRRPRRRAMAR